MIEPIFELRYGFPGGSPVKNLPASQEMQETWVWSLGQEEALEEGMVTHSSILAWRIPWTEEPSRLQSSGLQRVGHNWSNWVGFRDSSVGKESARNAGDPGSIPRLGRSAGEQIGYPLQYSWASLVAQLVKNLPAMWEPWVWSNWVCMPSCLSFLV